MNNLHPADQSVLMDEDEAAITALTCAPLNCAKQVACATLAISHIKRQIAAGNWPPPVKSTTTNDAIAATIQSPTWEYHEPTDWSGT